MSLLFFFLFLDIILLSMQHHHKEEEKEEEAILLLSLPFFLCGAIPFFLWRNQAYLHSAHASPLLMCGEVCVREGCNTVVVACKYTLVCVVFWMVGSRTTVGVCGENCSRGGGGEG